MIWVVAAALAQDEGDGRLPGAIPIRREDLAPPPEPVPAPPPTPVVDHSKIKVVRHEEGATDAPSPLCWALGIGGAVFGMVMGGALFASRLVVEETGGRDPGGGSDQPDQNGGPAGGK